MFDAPVIPAKAGIHLALEPLGLSPPAAYVMNPLKIKWEIDEEDHESMLRGRLSALSRNQPRYISPRMKAKLAEKRRLLKAQQNSQGMNAQGKDIAQFASKPSRRATMRVPMNAGFWRTLKWIFTGK